MIDSNSPINRRNSKLHIRKRNKNRQRRERRRRKKNWGWSRRRQSSACHIWDLGTCPAQVTRSRWYPWQVDGWRTEHTVNQRPWKRVTQRAPLTLSRSRIKVAWITNHELKITRNGWKGTFDYLSTKDFAPSFLFLPRLSSSLQPISVCRGIVFQEGWQSTLESGRFTLNYLQTRVPVCSSFGSFDGRAELLEHEPCQPGRLEKLKLHGFDGRIEDVVVVVYTSD